MNSSSIIDDFRVVLLGFLAPYQTAKQMLQRKMVQAAFLLNILIASVPLITYLLGNKAIKSILDFLVQARFGTETVVGLVLIGAIWVGMNYLTGVILSMLSVTLFGRHYATKYTFIAVSSPQLIQFPMIVLIALGNIIFGSDKIGIFVGLVAYSGLFPASLVLMGLVLSLFRAKKDHISYIVGGVIVVQTILMYYVFGLDGLIDTLGGLLTNPFLF